MSNKITAKEANQLRINSKYIMKSQKLLESLYGFIRERAKEGHSFLVSVDKDWYDNFTIEQSEFKYMREELEENGFKVVKKIRPDSNPYIGGQLVETKTIVISW